MTDHSTPQESPETPAGESTGLPVARSGPTVRRVFGLLQPYRARLGIAVLGGLCGTAANVVGPLMLGRATDLVFAGAVGHQLAAGQTQQEAVAELRQQGRTVLADVIERGGVVPGSGVDFHAFVRVLLLTLGLYVLASLFILLQQRLVARIVQSIAFQLRAKIDRKLARMPVSFFDKTPPGQVLSRVTADLETLEEALQHGLSRILNSALAVLGVVAFMLALSPLLTAVILGCILLSVLPAALLGKRAQPRMSAERSESGELTSYVEEMYGAHALITSFGRWDAVTRDFRTINARLTLQSRQASSLSGSIQPAMVLMGSLGYVLVAGVGALQVVAGAITVGGLQAFVQYSGQISQPLIDLGDLTQRLQNGLAGAERLFAILDEPEEEPDPPEAEWSRPAHGEVEFAHVSFRYAPETPVLEDVSFIVPAGSTVAIVGPTGAGKTTLGNLLLRFYEPSDGCVLVDGVDLTSIRRDVVRQRIGLVPQDVWLFRGTIADNIRYGRPGADLDEVSAAARAVGADHFLRTLPGGYDTVVDSATSALSAGEQQLVMVARAFLADPSVLLLDEATSGVDARSELSVRQAMTSLRRGRTSLIIAHRLSTIRTADLVLVLDAGRIIEIGTYDDLLVAGGTFAAMHAAAFDSVQAPGDGPATDGRPSDLGRIR